MVLIYLESISLLLYYTYTTHSDTILFHSMSHTSNNAMNAEAVKGLTFIGLFAAIILLGTGTFLCLFGRAV